MARFPRNEADIAALAREISGGLEGNAAVFPTPPVPAAALRGALSAYQTACDAAVAAEAAAVQATAAKVRALKALVHAMKDDLRYAESTVDFSDPKLTLLGWGGRKAKTPLGAPGQPGPLTAPRQGEGWVVLEWEPPADGGKVAAYKVERRQCPQGPWTLAGMSMKAGTTLENQQRGIEFEYRVVAVNKSGESGASNLVMVVL